jgi:uncharacterized protein
MSAATKKSPSRVKAQSLPPPAWEQLKAHVLERLARELPPGLDYHGLHHTRDDVLPAAERLACLASLEPEPALLLRTAALCHDLGFIRQHQEHEEAGILLASETLPAFGYSPAQVETVCKLIMATRLPQSPQDYLGELMCDADLDSLGRDDFFVTSHNLLREMRARGMQASLQQWYEIQVRFLSAHSYFTTVAESLRGEGKRRNIHALHQRLANLGDQPVYEIPD